MINKVTVFNFMYRAYAVIPLCVLLILTPYTPAFLQRTFGTESDVPAICLWIISVLSIALLVTCFKIWDYWMDPIHGFGRPYYLQALIFGSFLGSASSLTALLGIYPFGTVMPYMIFKNLLAPWIIVTIVLLVFLEIFFPKMYPLLQKYFPRWVEKIQSRR